jgi:uncharacterized integral membrane protein (TIGR00697 family)
MVNSAGYKWFHVVTALFVTTLIVSNIIAVKLISVWSLVLPAAVILFPIAYIIGDILTEVYGFARARQAIWIGFFCNLIAVLAIWLAGTLAPPPFWSIGVFESPQTAQQAYDAVLGFAPRLLLASFLAYLAGEFLNSIILAKLKVRTEGRYLWVRTIGSTIVGQGVDSLFFITIAFWDVFPPYALGQAILSQWLFKVTFETLATPITYWVVNTLKRSEGVDVFDRTTNFSPFNPG